MLVAGRSTTFPNSCANEISALYALIFLLLASKVRIVLTNCANTPSLLRMFSWYCQMLLSRATATAAAYSFISATACNTAGVRRDLISSRMKSNKLTQSACSAIFLRMPARGE